MGKNTQITIAPSVGRGSIVIRIYIGNVEPDMSQNGDREKGYSCIFLILSRELQFNLGTVKGV